MRGGSRPGSFAPLHRLAASKPGKPSYFCIILNLNLSLYIYLFVYLSIYLSINVSVYLSIYLCIYL